MPELPEVETVRAGLQELIVGRQVKTVEHDWPKSFPNTQADVNNFLIEAKVAAVRRRAKVLLFELSSDYTLVIHLKMTGQLVFVGQATQAPSAGGRVRFGAGHPSDSLVGQLPDKSTRVTIEFADGSHLYFNDQRKFGWVKLVATALVGDMPFMQKVGPEPLEDSFTAADFIVRARRRKNSSIKAVILDQTVLAGVGNIYADESLWGAKIHPATLVRYVSDEQLSLLLQEIKSVMTLSIEKGGSSSRNYIKADGSKGTYLDFARVFRREGQPCLRHPDVLIEKIRVATRGTHFCPLCQPDPSE